MKFVCGNIKFRDVMYTIVFSALFLNIYVMHAMITIGWMGDGA